jgi:hypothetical protein
MLASQFRADAPKQALVSFFHGSIHPVEPGLLELQNATVLAGEWFVTAGGNAHCDAFVQTPLPPCRLMKLGGQRG